MQLPSSVSTRLQYQHKSLIELIDGLSDEEVRRQVIPGKWSIYENIVHLQTYQHLFASRVKAILIGDTPVFNRYSADADPVFLDNLIRTSRDIMQDLLTTRKEMVAFIIPLQENAFDHKGVHPAYGKMNLIMWLNFFLLHEAHHLFTIFKLAATIRSERMMAS